MRVFISTDIEGIATTTLWEQATKGGNGYEAACRQMSLEARAACEGALAAGADYIRVKDAHGSGTNILPELLPRQAELTRSSCGSPWSMVYGVEDGSFDAAMFIGYHSAAGRTGNPLSHTETTSAQWIKLNGVKCSEFHLYSWACALAGTPSVFLSGDRMLLSDSEGLHPKLVCVPVKYGYGGSTTSLNPDEACARIREGAEAALKQNLSGAMCALPECFEFEICFKEHTKAARAAFYPGFQRVDDNTVRMVTKNYLDVLTAVVWVL